MTLKCKSLGNLGFECFEVLIEASFHNRGIPGITILGIETNLENSFKKTIYALCKNSNINIFNKKILVNVTCPYPELIKNSAHLLMPILYLILCDFYNKNEDKNIVCFGNFSLDGNSLFTKYDHLFLSHFEKKYDNDFKILFFTSLKTAPNVQRAICISNFYLLNKYVREGHLDYTVPKYSMKSKSIDATNSISLDYNSFILSICLAGCNNLLIQEPPGIGKSHLLTFTNDLYEYVCNDSYLVADSFYEKHRRSLINVAKPTHTYKDLLGHLKENINLGILGQSHGGVVIMDELSSFSSKTISEIQRCLDSKKYEIPTKYGQTTIPSDFILLATKNSCPCGYYKVDGALCKCSLSTIHRYNKVINTTFIERFDVYYVFPTTSLDKVFKLSDLKKFVLQTREDNKDKYKACSNDLEFVEKYCNLDLLAQREYTKINKRFSIREHIKFLKLSKTLSEFYKEKYITVPVLKEAMNLRNKDKIY